MTTDPCAHFLDAARNWIYAAIAAITAATVFVYFTFNPASVTVQPAAVAALIIAIAINLAVTLGIVPQIRDNIQSYDNCKGLDPYNCPPVSSLINTLGQVPEYLGVVAWALALVLELACLAALAGGWFTSWACGPLKAGAEGFEITGIASAVAAIGVLGNLLQSISDYQSCREHRI